ncbi:MAG: aldo/keto reductase [Chloroflexi bacterium]|nr:aldo/keto reductase [Chloroflexota bacterium]MCL5951490.1 aldo/keto reductase [Chloroflexota bacterium]
MEYRLLGKSGVRVSVIGLGTNRFGTEAVSQETVSQIISTAMDLGINFIDTSDTYSKGRSEETLGVALKGHWDRFVVATKFSLPVGEGPNDRGASRYHMMYSIERSLCRLQTDHVDLYYVHKWDPDTPIEEMLRGLEDLCRMGKVRYVGASQFAAWQLAEADLLAEMRGWSPFIVIQAHYHMLERQVERELATYCRTHHVGLVPFFPLAGGFLTGKYKQGQPPPPGSRGESSSYVQQYMTDGNYARVGKLTAWARAQGRGMNELAHAWLLAHPEVCSVISGSTQLEQVVANARAADWVLTPDEMQEVNTILEQ